MILASSSPGKAAKRHRLPPGPVPAPAFERSSSGVVDDLRDPRGMTLGIFFALDALVDFLAMHGHIFRGIDPDTYLVAFDTQHRDGYVVANHHRLANASRQYQHNSVLLILPGNLKRDGLGQS
jgi:hypothetical protein